MQDDISRLELHSLYDLLAVYTTKYTHMLRNPAPTPDFENCKNVILKLQTEIDFRIAQQTRADNRDLDVDGELVPVLI